MSERSNCHSGSVAEQIVCFLLVRFRALLRLAWHASVVTNYTASHGTRCSRSVLGVWRGKQDSNPHTFSGYWRFSKPLPYPLGLLPHKKAARQGGYLHIVIDCMDALSFAVRGDHRYGAGDRNRTRDTRSTKPMLYQLSYTSELPRLSGVSACGHRTQRAMAGLEPATRIYAAALPH